MTMIALPHEPETWFVFNGKPDEEALEKLSVRDKGTISSLLGAKNEIYIGEPRFFDLRPLLSTNETKSDSALESTDIAASLLDNYDFILVQIACSFRPAENCEMVRASIQVEAMPETSNVENATAYELFPLEVYLPITVKRHISISPSLKLNFEKVLQVDVSAFNTENNAEYMVYQPEITAFGKGNNIFGWDFNKSSGRTIRGVKDLVAIVQRPKSTTVSLEISILNCHIQTNIGNIPLSTFFLLDRNKEVMKKKVSITATL